MTASASPIDRAPKNNGDQMAFKTSWRRNNQIAFFFSFESLFQINHKEIPIKRYRVVQTGPNTHPGGLRKGFCKVAYQTGIAEIVKKEPIIPANSHTTTQIISFKKLLTLMNLLYQKIAVWAISLF